MTADDSAGPRPIHRRRLFGNALIGCGKGQVHANLLITAYPIKR